MFKERNISVFKYNYIKFENRGMLVLYKLITHNLISSSLYVASYTGCPEKRAHVFISLVFQLQNFVK